MKDNILSDNQPPPQAPRNPLPIPVPIFSMDGNRGGLHIYNLLQRDVIDENFLDLGSISSDKLDDKFISNDHKSQYLINRARIKYNLFPRNRQDTSNKKEALKIKSPSPRLSQTPRDIWLRNPIYPPGTPKTPFKDDHVEIFR